MKISIIIPVFNRAALLEETLQSVLQQTYADWECLVVDDGSTDDSLRVIQNFCGKDPRFVLKQRPKKALKGAPTCRNIGLAASTGDAVLFFDSDDIMPPTMLQDRIVFTKDHSDSDFWVFQTIRFTKIPGDDTHIWNSLDGPKAKDMEAFIGANPVWHTSGPIFKKSFLAKNKLNYTEGVASWQDWEFHIRVLLHSNNYQKNASLNGASYQRFHTDESINKKTSMEVLLQRIGLFYDIVEVFKKHGKFNKHIQYHFLRLFYFTLKKNFKKEDGAQIFDEVRKEFDAIPVTDLCFWKQQLLVGKSTPSKSVKAKQKWLKKVKEVYFSKRFPVDDFSHRTWYKHTHS